MTERRVLITGANRGIGRAFVEAYLARDWHVVATVRDPQAVAPFAGGTAERLLIEALDVTDAASVRAAAVRLAGVPIDVLVSNAALTGGPIGAFGAFDHQRFAAACAVNAGGFMTLVEAFAAHVAASRDRKILAISSRIGANPFYGYAEYFASKAALNALVKQVAVALAPRGIAVAAAHPGWVATEATAAQGQAPLTATDAAALLVKVIDGLSIERTGRFFDPDGSELPLVTQQHEVKFYSKPRDAVQ